MISSTEEEAKEFLGDYPRNNTPPNSRSERTRPIKVNPSPVLVQKQKEYDDGRVIIYTDGSCLKNPGGPGGYAAIIQIGRLVKELYGAESSTTNNRMEMKAAIEALHFFNKSTNIILYTDSQYLRKGFAEGWVEKWKRTGWVTKAGTPVLNKEFWQELDRLNSIHSVVWKWVKGHQGNPMNERCDELAVDAAINKAEKIGWQYRKRRCT